MIKPKTFLIGYTSMDFMGVCKYLEHIGCNEFVGQIQRAQAAGVSGGEILCSLYAKMCYKALKVGDNPNVTRVREIPDNIKGCFNHGHGSVFEHCNLNFVTTGCSRVFCYTDETEVLTKQGWKNITQLTNNDILLTKDPETHKCRWSKNKALHRFRYKDKVFAFKNSQTHSPWMTKDHILWAAKYDLRRHRNKNNRDIMDMSADKYVLQDIWNKRFVIDCGIDLPRQNVNSITIGNYSYNFNILLKWLGLLITDGTISSRKLGRNRLSITQSKKHNLGKIRHLMDSLFGSRWKEYGPYKSNSVIFCLSDKELMDWVIYMIGEDKQLWSSRIFDMGKENLEYLYEGAMLGNGSVHKENNHEVIYCGSKYQADFWQNIVCLIGKTANVRKESERKTIRKDKFRHIKKTKESYTVSVSKKNTLLVNHKDKIEKDHDGFVYCPETEDGLIFVRNKGIPMWSGNTHELVRHRAGCAYSQTSGRYVRPNVKDGKSDIDIVLDPILDSVKDDIYTILDDINVGYDALCDKLGLNDPDMPFDHKKKLTSALRRILPNGMDNEIGWSVNIRALRHMIMMRTSSHAEWEIRYVFNEVYNIVKERFPLALYGAEEKEVDGLLEITGMNTQPY